MNFNYTAYMLDIAIRLLDIAHVEGDESLRHYFRISSLTNIEELLQCINTAAYPALIVEDMRIGRYIDNSSEDLLDNQSYSFIICKPVTLTDYAERETVIKECEAIYKKIISRMLRDRKNDYKQGTIKTGLRNFDANSIYYQTVGPIGDNCIGIMVSFSMLNPLAQDLVYNAKDWNDGQ